MDITFPKVNNKLAFFDFDRTLVTHTYSKEYAANRDYVKECYYMLTALREEHALDRPLPCMQWYAKKLYDEGYGLYCLTHEIFNLRDSLKQEQLKEFYGDTPMTYFTVDIPEHKIDMMKAVALIEGCPLPDVIFVDDMMPTITMALNEGIDAKHVSDIVVLYETALDKQEQGRKLGLPESLPEGIDSMVAKIAEEAGIVNKSEAEIYEECRRLAEMNGRNEKKLSL